MAGLKAQGLASGQARAFVTPRRLTLIVEDLPLKSPGLSEERKGPRVNAPEAAIAGFVKSAGLASIAQAQIVKDDKKGDFYVVRSETPGRTTVYRRSGGNTATTVQIHGDGTVEEHELPPHTAGAAGHAERHARPTAAPSEEAARGPAEGARARMDRAFADIRRRPGFVDAGMDRMLTDMQAELNATIDRAMPGKRR